MPPARYEGSWALGRGCAAIGRASTRRTGTRRAPTGCSTVGCATARRAGVARAAAWAAPRPAARVTASGRVTRRRQAILRGFPMAARGTILEHVRRALVGGSFALVALAVSRVADRRTRLHWRPRATARVALL